MTFDLQDLQLLPINFSFKVPPPNYAKSLRTHGKRKSADSPSSQAQVNQQLIQVQDTLRNKADQV